MNYLLSIEAATRAMSAALFKDGKLIDKLFRFEPRMQHSEVLLPSIDAMLQKAGMAVSDLSAVAVTRGPGSFTSVRIGLATARGLAYPLHLPVYALNTLDMLAAEAADGPQEAAILPMLDARKGEVYSALYAPGHPLDGPLLAPSLKNAGQALRAALAAFAGPLALLGDGAHLYIEDLRRLAGAESERLVLLGHEPQHPRAEALGARVLARLSAGMALEAPQPLYLRRPEAVVNLEATRANK